MQQDLRAQDAAHDGRADDDRQQAAANISAERRQVLEHAKQLLSAKIAAAKPAKKVAKKSIAT